MAVDYAKSERTSCSSCGERILQDGLALQGGISGPSGDFSADLMWILMGMEYNGDIMRWVCLKMDARRDSGIPRHIATLVGKFSKNVVTSSPKFGCLLVFSI